MTIRILMAAGAVASCLAVAAPEASSQEKYLGEVILAGFNFCPRYTSPADGQLLAISQNTALFSLYGTMYGGDGRTTFALPDLRGRSPVHQGTGPGMTTRQIGSRYGAESQTLTTNELPSHAHQMYGNKHSVTTAVDAAAAGVTEVLTDGAGGGETTARTYVGDTETSGGGDQFSTLDPSLTMNYCVVTQGIYPSRN